MNQQIFYFFYNLGQHSVIINRIAFVIAEYSNPWGIVLAFFALMIILVTHKDWKGKKFRTWISEVGIVAVSVSLAYITALVLKVIFHAPRPFIALSNIHPLVLETPHDSFPSGHATAFFALAVALYTYDKVWGSIFLVVAVLVSLSRIISGVHFPGDVIAGAIIGSVVGYLVHYLLSTRMRK